VGYTFGAMRFFLLIIVAAATVVNGQKPEAQSGPDKRHSTPQSKDAGDSGTGTVVVVSQQTTDGQKDDHPAKPTSYFEELLLPANALTLALVIVGMGGIAVAIFSLHKIEKQITEMRRQVDLMFGQLRAMHEQVAEMSEQTSLLRTYVGHTETTATAAKESADALINSERGWVLAEIQWSKTGFDHVITGSSTTSETEERNQRDILSLNVSLVCKNQGKTPAWIMRKRIIFRAFESVPTLPDYTWNNNEDFDTHGPEPIGVGGESSEDTTLRCEGRLDSKYLIVYGFVKYRDVFSPDRETRFGYIITNSRRFVRIPGVLDLWKYNDYT
jgi:hypothetical protein